MEFESGSPDEVRRKIAKFSEEYGLDAVTVYKLLLKAAEEYYGFLVYDPPKNVFKRSYDYVINSCINSGFLPHLKTAPDKVSIDALKAFFAKNKIEENSSRMAAVLYLKSGASNHIPFYTLMELTKHIEALIAIYHQGKRTTLETGKAISTIYPLGKSLGKFWVEEKLASLYPDELFPEFIMKLRELREKLFGAKIEILNEMLRALKSNSADELLENCLQILPRHLHSKENLDFSLEMDYKYTERDILSPYRRSKSPNRISRSYVSGIGGITDLMEVICHVIAEIKYGQFSKMKDLLKGDLVLIDLKTMRPCLAIDNYIEALGLPEAKKKKLDDALDSFNDLEPQIRKHEKEFLKKVRKFFKTIEDQSKPMTEKETKPVSKGAKFREMDNLQWNEICIRLFTDTFYIRARGKDEEISASEIEFIDKRSKPPKLSKLWDVLRILAENNGHYSMSTKKEPSYEIKPNTVSQYISIIRIKFKEFFGINNDPFMPYDRIMKRHVANFKISLYKPDDDEKYLLYGNSPDPDY